MCTTDIFSGNSDISVDSDPVESPFIRFSRVISECSSGRIRTRIRHRIC